MAEETYHPLYLRGIEQFNRQRFFESHDSWEELWIDQRGAARAFYQGLIQAAAALHHLRGGNLRGARKLAAGSSGYLDRYRPKYQGLDVDRFLEEMSQCVDGALDADAEGARDSGRVAAPKIRLDPAPHPAASAG